MRASARTRVRETLSEGDSGKENWLERERERERERECVCLFVCLCVCVSESACEYVCMFV